MSITNKKKVSLSPQQSIKEHQEEKTDDNNIEKNIFGDDISIEEIHTVNDWEHADLGDEQRKQKFLRLMGAKKRKDGIQTDVNNSSSINHDALLSSEKKHCRTKVENEAINLELEKQFNERLQSNILHKNHEGFGFHGFDISSTCDSDDCHGQKVKTKFIPATTNSNISGSSSSEKIDSESHR